MPFINTGLQPGDEGLANFKTVFNSFMPREIAKRPALCASVLDCASPLALCDLEPPHAKCFAPPDLSNPAITATVFLIS